MVETGRTRGHFLALRTRNIWLITATWDIQLEVCHIPGTYNVIADTFSRVYSDKHLIFRLRVHNSVEIKRYKVKLELELNQLTYVC